MDKGGVCWFYWLHSGRQKHFLFWTLTFQGHRNFSAIYCSRKERFWDKEDSDNFTNVKVSFPCDRPDGAKEASECQPVLILSEQRIRRKPQGLGVRTAVRTRPTESICSHKCHDANTVARNSGGILHNRPDARASHPDALWQLMRNCCLEHLLCDLINLWKSNLEKSFKLKESIEELFR